MSTTQTMAQIGAIYAKTETISLPSTSMLVASAMDLNARKSQSNSSANAQLMRIKKIMSTKSKGISCNSGYKTADIVQTRKDYLTRFSSTSIRSQNTQSMRNNSTMNCISSRVSKMPCTGIMRYLGFSFRFIREPLTIQIS